MNLRPVRFTLVLTLLGVVWPGCNDTASDGNWSPEAPIVTESQSLGGPPGRLHLYLGQIDGTHYFNVGRGDRDQNTIPYAYKPGEGWREATALHRQVYHKGSPTPDGRRESGSWNAWASPPDIRTDGSGPKTQYIADLVEHRDRLLLGADAGIYLLDPETGDHELYWRPDRGGILAVRALPSGLYVGISRRGVRRVGR
jgi:hypothetical protein